MQSPSQTRREILPRLSFPEERSSLTFAKKSAVYGTSSMEHRIEH